jgi:hypothetical protein
MPSETAEKEDGNESSAPEAKRAKLKPPSKETNPKAKNPGWGGARKNAGRKGKDYRPPAPKNANRFMTLSMDKRGGKKRGEHLLVNMAAIRGSGDVTVVIGGRSFPVHRAIIGAWSEPLRELLGSAKKLEFEGDASTFEVVLDFMYTGCMKIKNIQVLGLLEQTVVSNRWR